MEEEAGQTPPPSLQIDEEMQVDEEKLAAFRERFLKASLGDNQWTIVAEHPEPGVRELVWRRKDSEDARGIRALKVVLSRLRYKGGWNFALLPASASHGDDPVDSPMPWMPDQIGILHVMFPAEDARALGSPRTQHFRVSIPEYPGIHEATEEQWTEWLFAVILHIEVHEAAEFFTMSRDNEWQRPFDPHADRQAAATRLASRGLPRML
jgi:hypothetical protein